ncbi:helix-turn-helix domain-containing protein [Streptomyces brevispora]|uniref:helix-turn-helix domain-containing protein n=1 Tax=Streptomyces brevispora TaxID=887462 RepID=UPI00371E16D8
MSIAHVSQALNTTADLSPDLSPAERLVLVLLAEHATSDGTAFASISHLARRANISPSTATRSLHRLTEAKLVRAVRVSTTAGAPAGWHLQLTDGSTGARA